MGFPMAGHLAARGGYHVTVYNRSAAKAQAWVAKFGGRCAATPADAARGANLNLSPDDAMVVAQRAAAGCQVLGLRFTGDKLVGTRFDSLRELLGDAFIAIELTSNAKADHSVLTEQRDEPSVQRVLQFLRDKLLTPEG